MLLLIKLVVSHLITSYQLKEGSIKVNGDASKITKKVTDPYPYQFTMPEEKVTITAEFYAPISRISVNKKTIKTSYYYGKDLDLIGATLIVTYIDTTTASVPITNEMVTGYNKTKLGRQILTVTYEDKKTTYDVVVSDYVDNISMVSLPKKTTYRYGEDLNPVGASIRVNYASGDSKITYVFNRMIINYDSHKLGKQTITVTYGGCLTYFDVTVVDYASQISMKSLPKKTTYYLYEDLDLTNVTLEAKFASGAPSKIVNIDKSMISDFNNKKLGQQVVKVTYGDLITTFRVKVIEPPTYLSGALFGGIIGGSIVLAGAIGVALFFLYKKKH